MNKLIIAFLSNSGDANVEQLIMDYLTTSNDIIQQEQKFNNEIFITVSVIKQINNNRNLLIEKYCSMIIDWFILKYIYNIKSINDSVAIPNINQFLLQKYI